MSRGQRPKCRKCGVRIPAEIQETGFRLCDTCLREVVGQWQEQTQALQWKRRIKYKCDMSPDEHGQRFADQGGMCAICQDEARSAQGEADNSGLVVDHDHTSGEVRSLLCTRCNLALGLFEDNIDWIHAALWYLRRHGNTSPQAEKSIRARDYVMPQKLAKAKRLT